MARAYPILTIGHSRHPLERFLSLLETADVSAVADVRSAPVSRFSPHFNRNALAASLGGRGIAYIFLGTTLGGRPERAEMYTEGRADYEKLAASPEFRAGLAELIETAKRSRVAVMCAEADPLDCHRCLLVGRALAKAGLDVGHILTSDEIVSDAQVEDRLLELEHLADEDLLSRSREERLEEAYRSRTRKASYGKPQAVSARRGAGRRD